MFECICLPTLACAMVLSSSVDRAVEKQTDEAAQGRVQLMLHDIQIAQFLKRYELLVQRELSIQETVRASRTAGDQRLPQYDQALQETREDLDQVRKRLVALESEKSKLSERRRQQKDSDAPVEKGAAGVAFSDLLH